MNQIKKNLKKRLSEIRKIKARVDKSLKKAPEGSLVVSSSHGCTQFFHKTADSKNKGAYIAKTNKKLITALAQKDYDVLLKKEIEKQEKLLVRLLKNLPERNLEDIYKQVNPAKREFINPHMETEEQFVDEWLREEYVSNSFHSENLRYVTERGEKVRSKTEKIIADKLYAMEIPYRYESPVYLSGYETLYPDFVILNTRTREEILFEHFGLMDNPEYCQNAISKINKYAQNGYFLGKNLIVTFELPEVPLDMNVLEGMLKEILDR